MFGKFQIQPTKLVRSWGLGKTHLVEHPCFTKADQLANSFDQWRQRVQKTSCDRVREQLHDPVDNDRLLDNAVQAIAEPAKFRVISKGNGFLFTAIQPAQGQMLSAWKNTRSSTMLTQDLEFRVQEMHACSLPGWFFNSVDYKAATDTIYPWATKAAFEGTLGRIFNPDLCWLSLQPGRMVYPEFKGDSAFSFGTLPQSSGQMMGHPLSFPLLCVINLGILRLACKLWLDELSPNWGVCKGSKREKLRQYRHQLARHHSRQADIDIVLEHVMVNGDDMLYCAPQGLIDKHSECVGLVGLKKSVGKNFVSQTACTINTQFFALKGKTMKRFGYLNQALINGVAIKAASRWRTRSCLAEILMICVVSVPSPPPPFRWLSLAFRRILRTAGFIPTGSSLSIWAAMALIPNMLLRAGPRLVRSD